MYELTHEQRLKLINHIGSSKIFLDFIGEKSAVEFDIPENFLKRLTSDFNVEQILRILQCYIFGLSQSEIEKYSKNFKKQRYEKYYDGIWNKRIEKIYSNFEQIREFVIYFAKSEIFQDFLRTFSDKYLHHEIDLLKKAEKFSAQINNYDSQEIEGAIYTDIFYNILSGYNLEQLLRVIWWILEDLPYFDGIDSFENPSLDVAEMDVWLDYGKKNFALNQEHENIKKKISNEFKTALEKVQKI